MFGQSSKFTATMSHLHPLGSTCLDPQLRKSAGLMQAFGLLAFFWGWGQAGPCRAASCINMRNTHDVRLFWTSADHVERCSVGFMEAFQFKLGQF